jgi:hypothetical protein
VIGDDPDEIEALERAERQAATMARAAAAVPRPGATISATPAILTASAAAAHQLAAEQAVIEAVYAHASGQAHEVVQVVKHLSEGEGGGVLIHVPSLGRERSTVESRLTFGDAAVAKCRAAAADGTAAHDDAKSAAASAASSPSPKVNPYLASSADEEVEVEAPARKAAAAELAVERAADAKATEAAAAAAAAAAAGAGAALPGPLPAPWVETPAQDGTGDSYYWNPDTSETTWVRPVATPSDAAAAPALDTAVPAAAAVPALVAAAPSPAPGLGFEARPTMSLLPGWVQSLDPHSGAPFYFHSASGQSSWQPPLCQQQPYRQPPAPYGQAMPYGCGLPMPPYGQSQGYGQPVSHDQGASGGGPGGKGSKDPFAGLTGAARRDAKRKAAGLDDC